MRVQKRVQRLVKGEPGELRAAFRRAGFDIRLVGGVVRDILLDVPAKDVDLCTDATPEEQIAIYQANRVKYIKTGISHGTITVALGKRTYEITSLRTETDHDGRRATVAYTRDWIEDLARRDLTINAMALTFGGELLDPFDGKEDLEAGVIRFVGDPDARRQEDYLRIPRMFRFHGRLGAMTAIDEATAAAVRRNAPGLVRISGERIWTEVSRIIAGRNGPDTIARMDDLGVADPIHLRVRNMDALKRAHAHTANPVALISALVGDIHDLESAVARWKWSAKERDLARFLIAHKSKALDLRELKAMVITGTPKSWVVELALMGGRPDMAKALDSWDAPAFPVKGKDLFAIGIEPGVEMGRMLHSLKARWIASDYGLSKQELLAGLKTP
jgi:tRNA nucleotidyltransferase (CCA-adding enzyme)